MRIFVSSSFEDLREHRTAAIRVLRQLGHEVLAMEDMIAGSTAPLLKVIEMVDRSEAYVGLLKEGLAKVDLTAEILRRWFGDAMLQQPMHIADLQRASVVDLLRLLDYPNDYVPVLTRHLPATAGQPATERVDVVDKGALNARLARSYLVELMDRARIV